MTTARVIYHLEDGAWWAESPDVPGWSAAADTLEELLELVTDGVPFALEREDVRVIHRLGEEFGVRSGTATAGNAVVHFHSVFKAAAGVSVTTESLPAGLVEDVLVG